MHRFLPLLLLPSCIDWSSLYQSKCGDGVVQAGEACDDGNASDQDACLSSCQWASCGDSVVRLGVEECDDGNQRDDDACSSRCLRCNGGSKSFLFSESGLCFTRYDEQVNWSTAENRCDAERGYLSTYVNSHEALAVETALVNGLNLVTWIGMQDSTNTGTYSWVSAEPAQWTEWAAGEPGRRMGGCVAQTPNEQLTVWSALPCTEAHGFVCEKAPPLVWAANHHGYFPIFGRFTWQDASAACQRAHAHLVTIRDSAEQAFVAGLLPGEFWIGAFDENLDGAFEWVTSEPANYSSFAPGEPDHRLDAQCFVIGVDEGWHDRPCTDLNAYLCEVE